MYFDFNESFKRIFDHEDFNNPDKHADIMGEMPDYEDYLKKKAIVLEKKQTLDHSDCLKPCYEEPILTREQACHLFRKYHFCKYHAQLEHKQGNTEKAIAWLEQTKPIKKVLVGSHVRLIVKYTVQSKFHAYHDDLIGEAYFLVVRAVDYFDWRVGTKFTTYATWVLKKTLGRTAYVMQRSDAYQEDGYTYREDSVPDRDHINEVEASDQQLHYDRILKRLFQFFDERECFIVEQAVCHKRTLEAIGKDLDITKERVRQLKNRTLKRMRIKACELGLRQRI